MSVSNSYDLSGECGKDLSISVVLKGDSYGLNDSIIHQNNEPMIEVSLKKENQPNYFISRYYVKTLKGASSGLALEGSDKSLWMSEKEVKDAIEFCDNIVLSRNKRNGKLMPGY